VMINGDTHIFKGNNSSFYSPLQFRYYTKSTVQCLDHPFHWWGKGYWANKSVSRDSISVGEKAVTKVTGARIKLL
jgi:hypothetical protein